MTTTDQADSLHLSEAIERILPSLHEFYRFEGPDLAALRSEDWKKALGTPLPEVGSGLDAVLKELAETVIPNGLRNGHPGFSGWVTTSPTSSGAAAHLAAAIAGSQRYWIHSFNFLESLSLDWLKQLLSLPESWQGTYTGGGSSANLIGLGAARQWAYEQIGVDPSMTGIPSGVSFRIYASSEVHHVVNRAAAVLGLGRRSVIGIPTDSTHRIDTHLLEERLIEDAKAGIRPLALVATAGTVNIGSIDPINRMADLAQKYGAWLHVDGAYGLFGKLDERVAPLFEGLERADSAAADPHKWMAAPLGNGVAFVRDKAILGRAFTLEPAAYLEGSASQDGVLNSPFDEFGEKYYDFNMDQSAPSRGVAVWAILKEIGAEGMKARVVRHNSFARLLADLVLADPRLELVTEPVLSICCFRFNDGERSNDELNRVNAAIAALLRSESQFVPSTTVVNGVYAIRPCYINPRVREEDVTGLAKRVAELGTQWIAKSVAP
jgi:aromatic-L-amino-acid decarboxylase